METIEFSLQAGLLLSTLLSALILGSLFYNPEIWVDDYPPDVRAAFGPIGPAAKRQRLWFAIPFFLIPLAVYAASLPGLVDRLGAAPNFVQLFRHGFITLEVFNLVDLVVLDWLFFIRLQPARLILPGTQGLPGYKDYGFHFRGFLFGTILVLALSLVMAGIGLRLI